MPQILYTGKEYQAPRPQGAALQALSQYGQQERARQTYELETARKDRDKFSEMLKMDPVYVSSRKSQDRIGKIMDDVMNDMTEFNKKRVGPMSTNDLIQLNRMKGEAMAEMGMIKATSDQITQAWDIAMRDPSKFNTRRLKEYQQQFDDTGIPMDGPALIPAAKSPFIGGLKLAKSLLGDKYTTELGMTQLPDGTYKTLKQIGYMGENNFTEDELINLTMGADGMEYDIQESFNELQYTQAAMYDAWVEKAGGNEYAAAQEWYRDGLRGKIFPKAVVTDYGRAYRDPLGYSEKRQQKQGFEGDVYIYNDKPAFQRGFQQTAISGEHEGMAMLGSELISIPADKLKYNVDIEFDKGSRIWVVPQVALFPNEKMEYAVDPTKNGEVWVTVDKDDDIPVREIIDSIELPNGKIKYRGVLKALTASGDVSVAKSLLGRNFNEAYDTWRSEWQSTQGKRKGGFKFPKIGGRGTSKPQQDVSNKYGI